MSEAYSSFHNHLGMLLDDVRNAAYEDAIKSAVTNDSVVLDLGAGLGLHGLMAARAGARKVYLVDPSPVLGDAGRVAVANDLGERVELINEPIEAVELPEQVDVIVSVLTGNFLVAEDLLPSLFLARDRWLKPDGKMIPHAGSMMVMPVSMGRQQQSPIVRLAEPVFDIDYSILRYRALNHIQFSRFPPDKFQALGGENLLMQLDFLGANSSRVDESVLMHIETPGLLTGCLGWFELALGEAGLSTGPMAERVHWSQAYMPLDQPLEVKQGDEVSFALKRPAHGDWTWTITLNGERQRMSTFLGRPLNLQSLSGSATDFVPSLDARGEAARFVLDRMDGQASVQDLASMLLASRVCHVPDEQSARRFVQNLVKRFGSG